MRNIILMTFAILILSLTGTAFGQNSKRTSSSPGKIKQAKKGVAEWTDILARKNKSRTKNARTTKKPNQATGGTIPVYKGNQRKRGVTDTDNWTNSKTKRKAGTKPIVILDQDTQTVVGKRKRKNH